MVLIAVDTSALVSLRAVADDSPNPLDLLLDSHTVVVPEQVVAALTETASYDDAFGEAARAVLDRRCRRVPVRDECRSQLVVELPR